jgi:hypothetical protein
VSLFPFENPIGFGLADFIAITVAALLIAAALLSKRYGALIHQFAERTRWVMLFLFTLPIALRLLLLPHHPVPTPDIYDEFGHLFVADTLRHFRLANPAHPMHRFFETFFILQEPTQSSIYPIGQGLLMTIFGRPWIGVIAATAAFCPLTYWMLRAWIAPLYALAGGLLAVFTFGPLCYWMNSYWGGSLAACAGCLVFGSIPRLPERRAALLLGTGLAILILTRPFESVLVLGAALILGIPRHRAIAYAAIPLAVALGITLLHNKRVTGEWTTLPYSLSQYQYGVPASLTIQPDPVPHRELTPQQALEYKSQLAFRNSAHETIRSFLLRLEYRVRFYRFFFLPPLYVALLFSFRRLRVIAALILFTLGSNLYPSFEFHYLAPIACLLLLLAVAGLEKLNTNAALAVFTLCCFHFLLWYGMHLFNDSSTEARRYETWSGINHSGPERRIAVKKQLDAIPGKLLVFVRYSPGHIFQDEWVYNEADIDAARVVWARDLGPASDEILKLYYPDRKVLILEPDARPPKLLDF